MIKIKSKNAILTNFKKKLILKEIFLPKPKFGEVLVKVIYSGICRSQIMEINGLRNTKKWLPHLLGHEGSGVVIDVGKGVKKVKKNDHVILSWIKSNGINTNGGKIKSKNHYINYGPITTFGSHTLVSENRLVKKPKEMNLKIAALFGCALSTGCGMAQNEAELKKNHNVLIYGIGGIGFSVLIMTKSLNIRDITVIDNNQYKLKIAKKMGIKKLINSNNFLEYSDFKKKNKNKFDICFETSGTTQTIEEGFDLIKNNGKIIFASHPKMNKKIRLDPFELIKGKSIIGSWGGKTKPDNDIKKYYQKIKKNKKYLKFLSNKIYKLKQINKAIKDFSDGKCLRPLIEM